MNAQEFRATILGRVQDAQQAAVADAEIVVTNEETDSVVTSRTNGDGDYYVPFLLPGSYTVSVQKQGFRAYAREHIELRVSDRVAMNATLEVGSTSETVTVTSPIVEATSGSRGTVVTSRQVTETPTNGRNAYVLARLLPGITPTNTRNFARTYDNGTSPALSISGAPNATNEILLDGITNVTSNYQFAAIVPSIDATQEFRVQTNNYDAEYGRFLGGVVNITTRSGTKDWHGNLFEFFRNDALDANDYFTNRAGREIPVLRYNQFGGSLGGPVIVPRVYNGREKTFFFFNYEGIRLNSTRATLLTVPTAEQRAGDFSRDAQRVIYDPFSTRPDPARPGRFLRDAFPGNRIPANRINPISQKLMSYYPQANTAGNSVTGINNFYFGGPEPDTYDSILARIDHQITDRQRFFVRVSWTDRLFQQGTVYGNEADTTRSLQPRRSKGVALDYVNALAPNLLLNVRYGLGNFEDDQNNPSAGFDATSLGFPQSLTNQFVEGVFPTFGVSGFSGLGRVGSILSHWTTQSAQASVTHIRGPWTAKLGADFRLLRQNSFFALFPSGVYNFDESFTSGPDPLSGTGGSGLASLLLGTPSSGSVSNSVAPAQSTPYLALYSQNDWKIDNRLTLNFGFRFDHEAGRTERYDRAVRGFAFGQPSPLQVPNMNLTGGLLYAGQNGETRKLFDAANLVAPRFGFAWQPRDLWAIRGGYGFYWSGTTNVGIDSTGFSVSTPFVASNDGLTPLNTLSNPFPQPLLQPSGAADGLATLIGSDVNFSDPSRDVPYSQQWSLSISRQFAEGFIAEIAYAGTRGTNLVTGNRQWNQLPDSQLSLGSALLEQVPNPFFGRIATGALSGRTVARGQLLRPYPQYTSVVQLNPTIGNSIWHSFQAKVERRYFAGLNLLASYTWSKLIDDVGSPVNHNNLQAERSLSSLDRRHRLVLSGSYELPFGRGKSIGGKAPAVLNRIISGWQLNGIYTAQSGPPLSLSIAANTSNSFGGGQRPNSSGTSAGRDFSGTTDLLSQYFAQGAFTRPAAFTFGNLARTLPDVFGPGTNNVDLSLFWSTGIAERVRFQLRFEAFNALNRTEFGSPNTTFGTAAFGTVGGVAGAPNPARQLQIAAKLTF